MDLPKETLEALRTAGKKRFFKQLLKVLVFYAIAMTALFYTGSRNRWVNWEKEPILFWGLFAALVIFPLWKFGFFKELAKKSFSGTVLEMKNAVIMDKARADEHGRWFRGSTTEMVKVDVCTVSVREENGKLHEFACKRELATFARAYYRTGDTVFLPKYANYPLNETNRTASHFCCQCGDIGSAEATACEKCGIPYPDDMTGKA